MHAKRAANSYNFPEQGDQNEKASDQTGDAPSPFSVRSMWDPLELVHSAPECPGKQQLPAGAWLGPVQHRKRGASLVGRRWGYEIVL